MADGEENVHQKARSLVEGCLTPTTIEEEVKEKWKEDVEKQMKYIEECVEAAVKRTLSKEVVQPGPGIMAQIEEKPSRTRMILEEDQPNVGDFLLKGKRRDSDIKGGPLNA